jgi:hypothetical protein
MKYSFYSQTPPIIIYLKEAKMFRCNYYTNINMSGNNKYIRLNGMEIRTSQKVLKYTKNNVVGSYMV